MGKRQRYRSAERFFKAARAIEVLEAVRKLEEQAVERLGCLYEGLK